MTRPFAGIKRRMEEEPLATCSPSPPQLARSPYVGPFLSITVRWLPGVQSQTRLALWSLKTAPSHATRRIKAVASIVPALPTPPSNSAPLAATVRILAEQSTDL